MMLVKQYTVGAISTNCYIASNSETKEALIIDPGDGASHLERYIEEKELVPQAVLLTHGHFDHCMAARKLAERYDIPIYVHEEDRETMEDASRNCTAMVGRSMSFTADQYFHGETDHLSLAGFAIDVFHTPGHTPGGVCYYIKDENLLFSGDTLFCESVGRTDFPGGSSSELVRSIRERLLPLPDSTKVLPGHNSWTTIGEERMYNPYIQGDWHDRRTVEQI